MAPTPRLTERAVIRRRNVAEGTGAGDALAASGASTQARARRLFDLAAEQQTPITEARAHEDAAAVQIRDPDGRLRPMPKEREDTVYGRAFNTAVQINFLSAAEGKTREKLQGFARENPYDRTAFDQLSTNYIEGFVSGLDPAIQSAARRSASTYAVELGNGISNNVASWQRQTARANGQEQVRQITNDIFANVLSGRAGEAELQAAVADELIEGMVAEKIWSQEEGYNAQLAIDGGLEMANIWSRLQRFDLTERGETGLAGALAEINKMASTPELVRLYGIDTVMGMQEGLVELVKETYAANAMAKSERTKKIETDVNNDLVDMVMDHLMEGTNDDTRDFFRRLATEADTQDPETRLELKKDQMIALARIASIEDSNNRSLAQRLLGGLRWDLMQGEAFPDTEQLLESITGVFPDQDTREQMLGTTLSGLVGEYRMAQRARAFELGVAEMWTRNGSTLGMTRKQRDAWETHMLRQIATVENLTYPQVIEAMDSGDRRINGALLLRANDLTPYQVSRMSSAVAQTDEAYLGNMIPVYASYLETRGEQAFEQLLSRYSNDVASSVRAMVKGSQRGMPLEQILDRHRSAIGTQSWSQNWNNLSRDDRASALETLPESARLNPNLVQAYKESLGDAMNYPGYAEDPPLAQRRAWATVQKNMRVARSWVGNGQYQENDFGAVYWGAHQGGSFLSQQAEASTTMARNQVMRNGYYRDNKTGELVQLPADNTRFGQSPLPVPGMVERFALSDHKVYLGPGEGRDGRWRFPVYMTSRSLNVAGDPVLDANGNRLYVDITNEWGVYQQRLNVGPQAEAEITGAVVSQEAARVARDAKRAKDAARDMTKEAADSPLTGVPGS